MSDPVSTVPPQPVSAGAYAALVNAVKLGGSILVSWGIALGVRLLLPRMLGPGRFGEMNYADALAAVAFLPAVLGIETWIRKEVGITIKDANAFLGGAFALRLVMTVLFGLGAVMFARLIGRSLELQLAVAVFSLGQLFLLTNSTLAALLHTAGKVDGLSAANIVGKLVWGGVLLAAVFTRAPLWVFASATALSELFKLVASWQLAVRHAALKLVFNWPATVVMIKGSLPFYFTALAIGATGRTDSALLGSLVNDTEVGWYGAVLGLLGLAMVVAPVVGWVLQPLLSRAAARSNDELDSLTRRGIEACLTAAMPISMLMGLGAELWVSLLYGEKFAPAALALRVISPTFMLTYLNIVASICLTALNRGWSVTLTSVSSLLLTPAINFLLIPIFYRWLGPSGGATACAATFVTMEFITTTIMLARIGRRAIDRRNVLMLSKTLAICVGCIGIDLALRHFGIHQVVRLLIEATVYLGSILAFGVLKPGELIGFVKTARAARHQPVSGVPG